MQSGKDISNGLRKAAVAGLDNISNSGGRINVDTDNIDTNVGTNVDQ